jgi:hypothetical protein
MNEKSNGHQNSALLPDALPKPDVVIQDGATVADMRQSLQAIEGLFFAVNRATFPLNVYQHMMMGMGFLKSIHEGIIKKLGPEEVQKIKNEQQALRGQQS